MDVRLPWHFPSDVLPPPPTFRGSEEGLYVRRPAPQMTGVWAQLWPFLFSDSTGKRTCWSANDMLVKKRKMRSPVLSVLVWFLLFFWGGGCHSFGSTTTPVPDLSVASSFSCQWMSPVVEHVYQWAHHSHPAPLLMLREAGRRPKSMALLLSPALHVPHLLVLCLRTSLHQSHPALSARKASSCPRCT